MKPIYKLIIAGLCLGLAVLTIGWTQIIQSITGPYGHTITDGTSGFTITGTTTMAYTAPDSVAAKKVIASTTAGDSAITFTTADATNVVSSINGGRDTLKMTADLLEWSGGVTLQQSKTITCGNIASVGGVYSLVYKNLYTTAANAPVYIWGSSGAAYGVSLGYAYDSTKAGLLDTTKFRLMSAASGLGKNNYFRWNYSKDAPSWLASDSTDGGARTTDSLYYDGGAMWGTMPFKLPYIALAKDTTLEIALFTRTCTRDTLAYMTGADSLTAAYIVNAFATRGAITCQPYIAGVVGGKLVVDRPAADTASYDRYSVTKILQR